MHSTLPGIIQLLKNAWQRVKPRYGSLIFVMLIPALVFALFLLLSFLNTLLVARLTPAPEEASVAGAVALIVMGLLIFLMIPIIIIVSTWAQVAIRFAIASPHTISPFAVYRATSKLIWPFLWVMILAGLVTMLGMVAIIPGLILAILLCFADWPVVTEQARGLKALALSREYVRGVFWKVAWRTAVPWTALQVGAFGMMMISNWYGMEQNLPFLYPVAVGIISIAGVLLTPIFIAYEYDLFLALKHRAGEVTVSDKQRRAYGWLAAGGCLAVLGIFLLAMILSVIAGFSTQSFENEYPYEDDSYEEYQYENEWPSDSLDASEPNL